MKRICLAVGCDSPNHAHGLCKSHDRRAKAPRPRPPRLCSIEGCVRLHGSRGWCNMHYRRWQADGSPGEAEARHRPNGTGYRRPDGYVTIRRHGHPLAGASGAVYMHRMVLFDAIGAGQHPCHWCTERSDWDQGLTADHLDWDRSNNALTNLVPSCLACNSRRFERRTDLGEENPQARLTAAQVIEIRAASGVVSQSTLAARYGVCQTNISMVQRRRTWKHIA